MTESEFLKLAEATLQRIQSAVEEASDEIDVDRAGNVLNLVFDDGFQSVINIQAPMQQLWMASRRGGQHFDYQAGDWIDTCSRQSLLKALSSLLTQKLGQVVELS